jgi:hypothetical protein
MECVLLCHAFWCDSHVLLLYLSVLQSVLPVAVVFLVLLQHECVCLYGQRGSEVERFACMVIYVGRRLIAGGAFVCECLA